MPGHAGDAVAVLKMLSNRSHAFSRTAHATVELLADVIAASRHDTRAYDAALT